MATINSNLGQLTGVPAALQTHVNNSSQFFERTGKSLDEINANKDYNAFNSHIKNDIKNNLTAIVNFVDYCTNFNNDLKNSYNNALKDLIDEYKLGAFMFDPKLNKKYLCSYIELKKELQNSNFN